MKKIFLDLDGVIVDFKKGYVDRVNEQEPGFLDKIGYRGNFKEIEDQIRSHYESIAPNDKERNKAKYRAKAKFWSFVKGDVQWWVDLPWMPDGKELFNSLNTLRQNGIIVEFNILSAPSKSDPCVPDAKRKWLDRHNISRNFDRIVVDNDKYKFAENSDDILIDDNSKKLYDWQGAGGTPILHENTSNTLMKLNKILLKDNS
jgi:5'(3')-deoxyribonucleotidase